MAAKVNLARICDAIPRASVTGGNGNVEASGDAQVKRLHYTARVGRKRIENNSTIAVDEPKGQMRPIVIHEKEPFPSVFLSLGFQRSASAS